jgi:hypothetical protein
MPSSPEYLTWRNMLRRCNNPADDSYKYYGGRGIKVCQRWASSYEAFLQDMGERPDGKSLDRIDVNGDYSPNNCRWADSNTQHNNRRDNRLINHQGVCMTLTEWARSLGIRADTLARRIDVHGFTIERALRPGHAARKEYAHGTRRRYERDACRCTPCRSANAARARDYRSNKNN